MVDKKLVGPGGIKNQIWFVVITNFRWYYRLLCRMPAANSHGMAAKTPFAMFQPS
jgi:hypothetical protein